MGSGTHWTYCDLVFSTNSIKYLTSTSPYFNWESHTVFLGISQKHLQFRNSIQQNPEIQIVSFPPLYSVVTLVESHRSLCGRT